MKYLEFDFALNFFVNAEQPNTPFPSVGCTGVGCFFKCYPPSKQKACFLRYPTLALQMNVNYLVGVYGSL